ncbi:hypothetical protein GGX14DRAFT_417014 [Mycena pura]|uniref:VASt domain-containing protein n=1 Tax=Mycena pura TaxID=153505 RepID=A0AAD7E551_9AGAR|nr:hypothetical protein GGX14DRAFT_417014 [Mycena pura]
MAPNFLSKFVKTPTQTRDRSLSTPSPVSRSGTPTSIDQSISSRNGSTLASVPDGVTSVYKSSNPSVAVIPPSPVLNSDDAPDISYKPSAEVTAQKIDGLPPGREASPIGTEESVAEERPPAPSKPIPSPNLEPSTLPTVRPQSSNKSLKQQAIPVPPLPSSHVRAATSPPSPVNQRRDEAPAPGVLSESPTDLRLTEFPQTSPTINGTSKRRDTDVFSVTSQGQKKTSRPWRRSAPKKPMGLAGAIAASGLAMANPGMTAPHQSTLRPQVMNTNENKSSPSLVTSPIQNPRKLTASPESPHRKFNSGTNGRSHRGTTDHRRRRTTGSTISHGEGEGYYPDEQGEYYSGLEESSNSDDGSESGDDNGSGLEDLLGEEDIPVTGFAVASNKRNADFHELFSGIPEGDYLIEDYGCALQREILIQGRLYVSENHLCFHANIFGWVTDLLIPIYEITTLEKKMTAFVIPNAIRVGTARVDYTFASFLSRDTTFDVIHNIWRLVRPGDAASIGSGSMEGNITIAEGTIIGAGAAVIAEDGTVQQKATTCACGKEGSHFSEVALDMVIPGTPDRIYNLIFASGFMKDFMSVNQKLLDIQVADWTPTQAGSSLLARNMSYIKPLYASLGPKQTKCEIRDETVHLDFNDYISTLTTTRTPDVPSGGVFSVKTRTCIMWATPLSSKVVVTTQVEWTGRSFIKGIIEKSAIDGQKVYHSDLEKAMKKYIQEHQSEFMPAGVDPAQVVVPEPAPTVLIATSDPLTDKTREQERHQRGLQWAWDTFDGASQVAMQSTKGALELIHDAWEHSTVSSLLYALIVALVMSNLWTYLHMESAVSKGRRKERELAKVGEKEQWVAGVVTALRDELLAGKGPVNSAPQVEIQPPTFGASPSAESLHVEIGALQTTLDTVESRVRAIRQSLGEIQGLSNVD